MDNLQQFEAWFGGYLDRLSHIERKDTLKAIATELRRRQMDRIKSQKNSDGTGYTPRKPRNLKHKKGAIKQRMFAKLSTASKLKLKIQQDGISIGFNQHDSSIANVHQYGLVSRVGKRGTKRVYPYPIRQILGFTEDDKQYIADTLMAHLSKR